MMRLLRICTVFITLTLASTALMGASIVEYSTAMLKVTTKSVHDKGVFPIRNANLHLWVKNPITQIFEDLGTVATTDSFSEVDSSSLYPTYTYEFHFDWYFKIPAEYWEAVTVSPAPDGALYQATYQLIADNGGTPVHVMYFDQGTYVIGAECIRAQSFLNLVSDEAEAIISYILSLLICSGYDHNVVFSE